MSQKRRQLRQKPRVNYYELEEPNLDEYMYCDRCGDYVYEYCSIHGPLLVIPDDKVPAKSNIPSDVSRAALSIPHVFLHIASSTIPGAGAGVFATLTLPRGVRFGPYRGWRTKKVSSEYCWQVYDCNNKPSHTIDGEDHSRSNWMRYVNCARHSVEQNLVAYQYQGEVYYRTIKIIPRSTELLVFYGTEYATSLQIDMRKYNSKNHYLQAIGYNPLELEQNDKATIDHVNSHKHYSQVPEEVTSTTIEIASTDFVDTKTQISKAYDIEDSMATEDFQPMVTDEDKHLTVEFKTGKNSVDIPFHNNGNMFKAKHNSFEKNRIASVNTNYKENQVNTYFDNHQTFKPILIPTIGSDIEKRIEYCDNDTKCVEAEHRYNFTKIEGVKIVWKCNECLKILTNSSSLKRHQRTHSDIKTYNCAECDYKTDFKYTLERHMSVHTGYYGHKCDLCPFATNSGRNLKKHVQRIHENGVICELCSYRVFSKILMERHRMLHGEKNVLKCNFCDYLSMTMKTLKDHVRSVHEKLWKKQ